MQQSVRALLLQQDFAESENIPTEILKVTVTATWFAMLVRELLQSKIDSSIERP